MSHTTHVRSLVVGERVILKTGAAIEDEAGKALVNASGPQIRGTWFFVDPLAGDNDNDGLTISTAVADLKTAYDLCTTNVGDGIVVLSSDATTTANTTSYLKQSLLWSKNSIAVVGIAAPNGFFGRARIANVEVSTGSLTTLAFVRGAAPVKDKITRTSGSFITDGFEVGQYVTVNTTGNGADGTGFIIGTVEALTLTLTSSDTLVTETAGNAGASTVKSYNPEMIVVSGSNNSFYNLHISNGSSDVGALGCLKVTGNRNYFSNVHGVGAGHATPAAATGAYDLQLVASENVFDRCYFGTNSVIRGAANGSINLGLSTTQIGQNFFNDCHVIVFSASGTGAAAIKIADVATLGGWIQFRNCTFVNWNSGNVTSSAVAVIGATPTNCGLLMHNCGMVGWTAWMANVDRLFTTNAVGAAGTGGIANSIV